MTGDKLTRHDGSSSWRCPISLRIFATEREQAEFTAALIEQQGADLTLSERRTKYSVPTPAAI
ncbi:hypothetical protein PLANPX_4080 [Lacipirellula parvula]|uniref:Uncharacterized protein n=1 Tax=Lacipirellula parvula TaxID=2650471 RepID=A0A5K7XDB6_9BACT|nr:hypothetical protein PLANPX_4080 [Lacipirellula parvula]